MGEKSTGAWGSMAWFMFIMLFWKIGAYCGDQSAVLASDDASCFDKSENSISHQHARRKLDDIAGKYKDDRYDRMWFPYPGSQTINTSSIIDTQVESDYRLQSTVMRTAVRAINVNESLEFDFDNEDPILEFYVYMHFAELENLQENQHREFNIELNGNLWEEFVVPKYLHYSVGENWQGDPCAPTHYPWDGLNCSYNGYNPPRIISLDLSNNSLTGTIPEILSQLPNLSVLNLEGNKLSGPVPAKKRSITIPVVTAVVTPLVILLALGAVWIYRRKQEKEGYLKSDNKPFTYTEIVNITNKFHKVLGKGGFGTVYHGYPFDGTQVAVKMLSQSSAQGSKQFRTELPLSDIAMMAQTSGSSTSTWQVETYSSIY
ncbi:hypothetical protein ACOSQ4_020574 [Xanthoceras sorbifolium]